MPDYRRFHVDDHPVFLTIVTQNRDAWLADRTAAECLLGSMRSVKIRYPFTHLAHVILSDHVHWILRPEYGVSFSDVVAAVKRNVSWRLKERGVKGPLWQKRFYDHVIRNEADLARHLDYVHYNPVKHGYVARAADHPLSSFAQWVERGVYAMEWGSAEPERIKGMNPEQIQQNGGKGLPPYGELAGLYRRQKQGMSYLKLQARSIREWRMAARGRRPTESWLDCIVDRSRECLT